MNHSSTAPFSAGVGCNLLCPNAYVVERHASGPNYSNSRSGASLEFRRPHPRPPACCMSGQRAARCGRLDDTAVLAPGALQLPAPTYDRRRREYLACGWLPPNGTGGSLMMRAPEIEQIDAGLKSRTQALAEPLA